MKEERNHTYSNLLTFWEANDLRVECRRVGGEFAVQVHRANQLCAEQRYLTETTARKEFEKAVDWFVEGGRQ